MSIAPTMIGTVVPAMRVKAAVPMRVAALPRAATSPRSAPPVTFSDAAPALGARVTAADWRSGFCGPHDGECADALTKCPGLIKNGEKAARPVLYCACFCHDD